MSPKAQRIAIAEACGWTMIYFGVNEDVGGMIMRGTPPHENLSRALPEYLADLDAMRAATATLSIDKRGRYVHFLVTSEHASATFDFGVIEASAAERAKAFLRTIDKWDDSK